MWRVVIAGDKLKGSASASAVASALERGLRDSVPDAEILTVPTADGGDGTIEVALSAGFSERRCPVRGAYGERREARFAYEAASGTALIEVAEACGLRNVDPVWLASGECDARSASSWGVGELVLAALDEGARSLVLGLGGSATTDGGLGMIGALGVRVLNAAGRSIRRLDEKELQGASLDTRGIDPRLETLAVHVACDVANPLTGPNGAAVVYGPQKGLVPEQVPEVDAALRLFGETIESALGAAPGAWATAPGAGAAGGIGFAALAVLGGEVRSGIELVLDVVGFDTALRGADLVITSEGRFDEQTLSGKAPAGVAARAGEVPVVLVCGSSALPRERALDAGFRELVELVSLDSDVDRCMRDPLPLLERIGRDIGSRLPELAARPEPRAAR